MTAGLLETSFEYNATSLKLSGMVVSNISAVRREDTGHRTQEPATECPVDSQLECQDTKRSCLYTCPTPDTERSSLYTCPLGQAAPLASPDTLSEGGSSQGSRGSIQTRYTHSEIIIKIFKNI